MDWPTFVSKAENPGPGEAVVEAAIKWFKEKLGAHTPALAEGFTEAMVESQLPSDIVVQACCKRLLRAVEAVAAARVVPAVGHLPGQPQQHTSAQSLAAILAPTKTADVSSLLDKASMKTLSFGLQAEQSLWSSMLAHTEQCKAAGKTPFLFVDPTSKESLPMWLTPDQIGGKFHLRDEREWTLEGAQAISSLQDLSRALKSATASARFFRSMPQWLGAFLRYAAVAVATQQLTWPDVMAHIDVVAPRSWPLFTKS